MKFIRGEKRQTKRFCLIYFLFCFSTHLLMNVSKFEIGWVPSLRQSNFLLYIKMQISHFQFLFHLAHEKANLAENSWWIYPEMRMEIGKSYLYEEMLFSFFYGVVSKMFASLYSIGIFILKGSPKFLNVWRMSLIWTQRVSDKVFFKV